MSTLLLKQSLLLTHGTVYGQIDPLAAVQCADISPNINQWNAPDYNWRDGQFEIRTMSATETGTMTDNSPVDFIHWAATGSAALSPMAPWRNCMKLLRHI